MVLSKRFYLFPVSCQRYTSVPGSPYNISTDNKGVLKAVLHGAYSFNNQTNDAFLFKPSAIEKAERQVWGADNNFDLHAELICLKTC